MVTIKKITLVFFVLVAIAYLLSCLTPYVNPVQYWPFTFLALGFPFLLAAMLILLPVSFFVYGKKGWIWLLLIVLGYKNISSTLGFHIFNRFSMNERKGSFRLLSWNVCNFRNNQASADSSGSQRRQMLAFIKEAKADVLCFQDFSEYTGSGYRHNISFIKDSLGYPYVFFSKDFAYNVADGEEQYGTIIFSKFPIIDSGRIVFPNEASTEALSFADVLIHNQKLRFYNAHLRSMEIHTKALELDPAEVSFLQTDTALILHKSTFKKLKHFDALHVEQAKTIRSVLDTTSIPFIYCSDMNSVPATYVYHYISKGLQDAFTKTDWGLGTTYDSISPTLRIDVTLLKKPLQPVQHHTPHLHLSDHFPNLVDIALP